MNSFFEGIEFIIIKNKMRNKKNKYIKLNLKTETLFDFN